MDQQQTKASSHKGASITVGIVLLVILFLIFCFRIVGVGDIAIITTFGNVTSQTGSGVLIKAPWPIQSLTKMNVQVQKEQQDASAASNDLQTVTTTVALNYHLTPNTAGTVFRTVGVDYKTRIIDPLLQETIKATVSQFNAEELISKRPVVEASALKAISSKLGERGITVDNISIVNFNFSTAFDQAIEAKQVAQQNAQKAQYELQSAETQAKAQEVQATTLTPDYLRLQAINKWDGHMPQYVGADGVFGIPLTK
ncbi:mitochondrial prohibitin complex protein 1 [Arthrobacter sp. Hiyo8]|uniref:prohibitin family protein n=1 Tax=Arthrobacter sp. Hiyo1 TaxID=1588020 RepID=UPI0006839CF4|nr:prohibitin family protein [Arthrobacter sp. Hiyo1]BAS17586.1 mitochondrial prohibitin complex protein 1 [Arthrobacter sp. Hiyo8]GAP57946.1 mitochondrial prohibitin complex protein 1 [Arthrobacter sp. Hiyo1]